MKSLQKFSYCGGVLSLFIFALSSTDVDAHQHGEYVKQQGWICFVKDIEMREPPVDYKVGDVLEFLKHTKSDSYIMAMPHHERLIFFSHKYWSTYGTHVLSNDGSIHSERLFISSDEASYHQVMNGDYTFLDLKCRQIG